MRPTKNNILSFFLLAIILTPIVFIKLDSFSIRLWDESMFAVNSYEMLQRNELIVPYFDGIPNLWNSKPPLLMWVQMLSIKTFGFNELAVRLPSAIAVALTLLIVFFYLKKNIDNTFAWIVFLLLITSQGFYTFHTGRTGDSDAILTLLLTTSNIIFLDSVVKNNFSNKRLFVLFIILTLAFLCKSFASILFGLGYLIILIVNKKHITTQPFKKAGFWLGTLLFIVIAVGFILIRNHLQPGYIDFVLSVDIGRMTKEVEQHKEPFFYYIDNLAGTNFRFWFFFALIGAVMIFSKYAHPTKKIFLGIAILSVSYLLIISSSVSKLPWYTMPLYPLLAILAAIPIYELLKQLNLSKQKIILFFVFVFAFPYDFVFGISQSNHFTPYEQANEATEQFIFNEINDNSYTDSSYVLHAGFPSAIKFYQYKLKEKGKTLFITNTIEFPLHSTVIVSSGSLKEKLKLKFNLLLLDSTNYVSKYKVISPF